jgi:hypothetical protein
MIPPFVIDANLMTKGTEVEILNGRSAQSNS